jgi:hypothetical protein
VGVLHIVNPLVEKAIIRKFRGPRKHEDEDLLMERKRNRSKG